MKRTGLWLRLVFIAAILAAAMFYFTAKQFIQASKQSSEFTSAKWQDPTIHQTHARLEMADDIIAHRLLNGKTRDEVLALLGPEEPDRPFLDEHLVYYLGPERNSFISIDNEWLAVRFDAGGVVETYRILRD